MPPPKLKAFGSPHQDDLFIPGDKFTKKMYRDFFSLCVVTASAVSHIMVYLELQEGASWDHYISVTNFEEFSSNQ